MSHTPTKKAPHPIRMNDWRYKIAQFILSLLYRRPWHHISPWKHAGIAANAVLMYEGKVLLCRRRGNIEGAGKLGLFGGHLDLERNEGIFEALAREIREECGICLTPDELSTTPLVHYILVHGSNYIEMENANTLVFYYTYPLTNEHVAQLHETEEAHELAFYTREEIQIFHRKGEIVDDTVFTAIEETFKRITSTA